MLYLEQFADCKSILPLVRGVVLTDSAHSPSDGFQMFRQAVSASGIPLKIIRALYSCSILVRVTVVQPEVRVPVPV